MQHVFDALGYILLYILAVQVVRLYRWLQPVDDDSNIAFSAWGHLLVMAAVVVALPFRFMPEWSPRFLFFAFLCLVAGLLWHLMWNGRMLSRAERHHGRYKLLWF